MFFLSVALFRLGDFAVVVREVKTGELVFDVGGGGALRIEEDRSVDLVDNAFVNGSLLGMEVR